ncbi:AAA family ATPase [Sphaerimonospora thailandensis]|uniref:ATP-binding protein n=1 Tax=Sphaerimonospora thailandensis TaxID=795644 RepID=A0A8J3RBM2_9ACTN|nr:ATP-binding protein [Sphaerimonospora thailandensis]GIH71860.1 ATP-binding protein [Sphaerimonospora thailandensis]
MVTKPERIFDRVREWQGLVAFATGVRQGPGGAGLGVVSGRRRQGKSFLLQALTEATGGLYFAATEATEAESLRLFTEALTRYSREIVSIPFRDWNDAIAYLFRAFRGRPVPVVIDEFPFLSKVSPSLPSIIQRELGPGGSGGESDARLVLCGSAMSVMGGLLSGNAPLRGRAGLELVVQPFRYRDAAQFWGIDDPRLAVLVHAIVGGTPAYRYEFTQGDAPEGIADFDPWVIRTVLNPQKPLFREARYLLAEETDIRDPALYHSVLAAIASGNTTNGGIANYIGRKSDQITHPLNVLEDSALIAREPDLFRAGRVRYRIVEPLITFYQAVMRRRWAELEIHRAERAWSSLRQTFLAQVVGPHFEALCRSFAVESGEALYGDFPAEVGSGVVNDPAGRCQIEIDVAVLDAEDHGRPRRILSLGEVKWGETMGHHHVERLARARDLLALKGYDTRETVLACYGGSGFTEELRASAADDRRILLVDPERLYRPD